VIGKLVKKVYFKQEVIDSLLTYSRNIHPREGILLLRGKVDKDKIIVTDLVIPPLALHGEGFSSFPLNMIPIDFSILGVAHSHPSGFLKPSLEDLSHSYGKMMVILIYPYSSREDVGVFDKDGNRVIYTII